MADEAELTQMFATLEEEVRALRSSATVEPYTDGVIYRPPLWSQNSAYSAQDDRQLIDSALWPGVVDFEDLKVTPRALGANLSVDVDEGHVIVAGTDHNDQGSYLCALSQKVNLPVVSGPTPPNVRWDIVLARVHEPVDTPATWELEIQRGRPNTTGAWDFDPSPPSSTAIALIRVGDANTTQITADRIVDYRSISRGSPIGSSFVLQNRLGPMVVSGTNFQRWGTIERLMRGGIPGRKLGPPLDVEARIEGIMRTETWVGPGGPFQGGAAIGTVGLNFAIGPQGSPISHRSEPVNIYSGDVQAMMPFSRTFVVSGVQAEWGHRVYVEAVLAEQPLASPLGARFHSGTLTLRVSPGGTQMYW